MTFKTPLRTELQDPVRTQGNRLAFKNPALYRLRERINADAKAPDHRQDEEKKRQDRKNR